MGPARGARVPSGKDCPPLSVLTEAEEWDQGVLGHPLHHSEVVTDLWHPWVGVTRVGK